MAIALDALVISLVLANYQDFGADSRLVDHPYSSDEPDYGELENTIADIFKKVFPEKVWSKLSNFDCPRQAEPFKQETRSSVQQM